MVPCELIFMLHNGPSGLSKNLGQTSGLLSASIFGPVAGRRQQSTSTCPRFPVSEILLSRFLPIHLWNSDLFRSKPLFLQINIALLPSAFLLDPVLPANPHLLPSHQLLLLFCWERGSRPIATY